MQNERSWMYNKNLPNRQGLTPEFITGLRQFLNFASTQVMYMDGKKIRCACRKCHNGKFLPTDKVEEHLCRFGFTPNYYNWTSHGEPFISDEDYGRNFQASASGDQSYYEQFNPYQRMVIDASCQNYIPETLGASSSFPPTSEQMFATNTLPLEEPDVPGLDEIYYKFQEVLSAANEPLYSGCDSQTKLSLTSRLLNIKADHNMSQDCFNDIVQAFDDTLPRDHNLPLDFYSMKKLVKDLGLPVERIDVCRDGCMLYWGDDAYADVCKFCNQDRYKTTRRSQQRRKAHSQLFYLPLTPRLQRLYASKETAEHMTWHATHQIDEGLMCHPSDADAWKNFDRTYLDFAKEI